MPIPPGCQPINPGAETPEAPPRSQDEREEEGDKTEDDEDTGSDPWWM